MKFLHSLVALAALVSHSYSQSSYNNPILTGFHPDPTITFVPELNNTFFFTSSSFLMFPGLPIYASHDLVHWKHVSNALTRPSQIPLLPFLARGATSGIYAPTLRWHQGVFYLTTTVAHQAIPGQNYSRWDNFVLTTSDPYDSDAWSEPVFFDYPGIDPSPFWDDDGTAYIQGSIDGRYVTNAPIDLATGEWLGPHEYIWNGTGLPSPEAPHIYRKDDYYYLVEAEGGTRERHRVVMARSRSLSGPWEEHPDQPPLTAYLNTSSYFQAVGHADLVQDGNGSWWAVALANRAGGNYAPDPYNANFPMGRETVLTPVSWEEGGWPSFTNISGTMTGDFTLPSYGAALSEGGEGGLVGLDEEALDFAPGSSLPIHLFHWRLPIERNYAISEPGHEQTLRLRSSVLNLTGYDGDATRGRGQTFVARKQTHTRFRFSVDVAADWQSLQTREDEEVGITALQDQSQHFDLGVVLLKPRNGNASTGWNEATATGCAIPHIRFRGISTTPFRLPENMLWVDQRWAMPSEWYGKAVRLQVEAVNTTHYAFSAGSVPDGEGEPDIDLQVIGYATGNKLIPYYSGVVVGTYATSNGRYGEGAFDAYVQRWRYSGLEQVRVDS